MNRLSDNYYHRKCYLERNQVPTLSIIKNKMSEPLANVYFKSMSKKVKVYTDPMPSTKPTEWYMPPEEILAGRAVLKPIDKKHLKHLNATGLWSFGEKLKNCHYQSMLTEMHESVKRNDDENRKTIFNANQMHQVARTEHEEAHNSHKHHMNLKLFETMYVKSITNLENIVLSAAKKEVEQIRTEVYQRMQLRLNDLLKSQVLTMQNEYEDQLNKMKAQLKENFVTNVEHIRSDMAKQIHDSNYEKHLAIEKLRHFVQCQNLACQVYVALKEKEACESTLEQSNRLHKKTIHNLEEEMKTKDKKINLEIDHQKKSNEINEIWKTKICHVVKRFQLFVEYCLRQLPMHAEFFLNMEKLMLLQLSETLDSPDVKSNICEQENTFVIPEPRPHPFYLFCDVGYKPDIDQNLCPKHATSSSSQLPVIVIDRRCIYSACDNYKVASKKVAGYVSGDKGEDIEDNDNYDTKTLVKYSSLMQLLEMKLESSLMQIIEKELPNSRDLPINCSYCKIPFCYCTESHLSKASVPNCQSRAIPEKVSHTGIQMTKQTELQIRREPKWESYRDFVTTARCLCSKTAQKDLLAHLPPYMKNMSPYVPPELPNYEACDVKTLKKLVDRARKVNKNDNNKILVRKDMKDAFTQYSDHAFEALCTCLSDDKLSEFLKTLMEGVKAFQISSNDKGMQYLDNTKLSSPLKRSTSSFATARAHSLRHLLHDDPSLKEIFAKPTCD